MFKKKNCSKCGNKISDRYDFCPSCGNSLSNKTNENMGMLGKTDSVDELQQFTNSIFGGVGGRVIGKMINNTMKMLEKEMQKEMQNQTNPPKTNMELYINGKRINLKPQQPAPKKPIKQIPAVNFSNKNLKKISSLPKQEPLTNIKRISNKVIYEIEIPGVNSIEDVSIIKLENSIEIKALAKDKVYFKLIPINLPITDYNFSKSKLILELGGRN